MLTHLLINLGLTILIETPIYWLFLRREKLWAVIVFSILLNAFTLPLATMAFNEMGANYYLVEFSVLAVEGLAVWIFWKQKPGRAWLAAFAANFVSAATGILMSEGGLPTLL